MSQIDKRGKLAEEPFTRYVTKDGKVLIQRHGRQIMILKGEAAMKTGIKNIKIRTYAKFTMMNGGQQRFEEK